MTFLSKLMIRLSARHVGTDAFGNSYFEGRKARHHGRPARYVIYKGQNEASKVPADWHGWLHHTEHSPPPEQGYQKHSWQQPHMPNLTGTKHAYRPAGHMLKGGKRAVATGDYQAWSPDQQG